MLVQNYSTMVDIFSEIKKASLKQHLAIAGTAFAFALGVNYLLFTTDTGVKLQASAIEATIKTVAPITADIEVVQKVAGTDRLQIRSNRAITQAKSIEFTLLANPAVIALGEWQAASADLDGLSNYPAQVTRTSNMPGVALYSIVFDTPVNITAGTSVASIAITSTGSASTIINIATVRARTADGDYELLASGVTLWK
jgi:hypothetical protein